MKIHTTQDLNTLGINQQLSTNSKVARLDKLNSGLLSSSYMDSVSFKGGASEAIEETTKKIAKKAVKALKDVKVGDIKEKATPEVKKGDSILLSDTFNKMLDIAEYETMVQAGISAAVCMVLRPLTIMGISNDKSKQDNMYASAHSMASGLTGLVATTLLTNPFKMGESYAYKHLLSSMKHETIVRLFPHVDPKSLDKPFEQWVDKNGNKFITDLKDVAKIPSFKDFANISKETFEALGVKDVDWAVQKGKSFNEVMTKDGKSLYDLIDWSHIGVSVEVEGSKKPVNVLLKNLDEGFLKEIISDAGKDSPWSKLDINSVYEEVNGNKIVKDFREWKEIGTGNQWKLDLDSSYISSAMETADYIPEVSGAIRKSKDGDIKLVSYLKNGKDGQLGTAITQEMVEADKTNEVQKKLITWIPDIISRPVVAMGTIALIPWMLKNVFHLEKSSAKQNAQQVQNEQVAENKNNEAQEGKENVSFKAGAKKPTIVQELFGKYGKFMYESEKLHNLAEKMKNIPGSITEHMATLGALLTSSVYVGRTLNNDKLDNERKKTLAINQTLCFIVPTICAYTISAALSNFNKKVEYRYSGLMEQKLATGQISGENAEKLMKSLPNKLKGVRIFSGLATFTLVYRYLTPVLITPVANWISDKIRENKQARLAAQQTENKVA